MRALRWLGGTAAALVLAACAVLGDLPNPSVVDNVGGDAGLDGGDAASDVTQPPADGGGDGGVDAGPVATEIVPGIRPWNLVVDDTYVYWTEPFVPHVGRAEKKDGANRTYLASGTGSAGFGAWGLALDLNYVYWVTPSAVLRCAKSGCSNAPTKLADATARHIAVDDTYAYYTDTSTMSLDRVPKGGGAASVFATFTAKPEDVVLDGAYLYVTAGSSVIRVAVADGASKTLVTTPQINNAFYLTVALDKIYFTEFGDPAPVDFVATSGADAGFGAVALNQSIPFGITNDATDLYWVAAGLPSGAFGKIVRCSKSSCNPAVLASAQNVPKMIVTDGTAIYWTNNGRNSTTYDDGAVVRMPIK